MGTENLARDPIDVLAAALDQATDVLAEVRAAQLDLATPCDDWTVAQLVDHLVATPTNFATLMRGGRPDFTSPAPRVDADRAERFRVVGEGLLRLWRDQGGEAQAGSADPAWQLAELAVHTWDLATAIGYRTDTLDPEVAQRGLEFMRANLTDENRGQAFQPERAAPANATTYTQIAAFAGRHV
ncbi:MAG: TIGR03086 family metal-binding protein [Intrasporangium sp.]|uniref:TIGR03086 family metal-binding protein n=1 Tax=Intrasporangium sp. TaxID=1925024 RepID=UPI00264865DF|nr:TIGR03086 family metal-binding protein [Intrasporangium sp.]MDN5795801.1 TIGR03086 family metal-binding protein [Intrasporangium sp.]